MKNTVIYIGRKNGKKCENTTADKKAVLYCGIRGQGVVNTSIYLFGFVLIPIPVQCVAVRWGQ
jgi:hypothetical protein